MEIEDVISTLQFQLVLVVAREDGFHRLVHEFAVEPEVVCGDVRSEVVVDAERFLVQDEVELRVLECRKFLRRFFVLHFRSTDNYAIQVSNISS